MYKYVYIYIYIYIYTHAERERESEREREICMRRASAKARSGQTPSLTKKLTRSQLGEGETPVTRLCMGRSSSRAPPGICSLCRDGRPYSSSSCNDNNNNNNNNNNHKSILMIISIMLVVVIISMTLII